MKRLFKFALKHDLVGWLLGIIVVAIFFAVQIYTNN
jgi:hypothetical protein